MNRLEIYGIGLLVLLLALAGAYARGHHAGYTAAEDRAAMALAVAQQKADEASAKSFEISQDSAEKIEVIRTRHENELTAVRGSLVNRLCRPAPNRIPVSADSITTARTDAALESSSDTGGVAVALVGACQSDSDSLTGLQAWVRAQQGTP